MTSRKKFVQYWAHGVTIISAAWLLFSLIAVFDWFDARRTVSDPNAIPDLVIWSIHLFLIGLAVYLFKTEKPREALWFGDEDEEQSLSISQQVDIPLERQRLLEGIRHNLKYIPRAMLVLTALGGLKHLQNYFTQGKIGEVDGTIGLLSVLSLLVIPVILYQPLCDYFLAVRRHQAFTRATKLSVEIDYEISKGKRRSE